MLGPYIAVLPQQTLGIRIFALEITVDSKLCFKKTTADLHRGYQNGVIGGTLVLPSFFRDFQLPPVGTASYDNIIANVVSVLQLGGLLGAILTFPAMKYWGRKIGLIIAAAVYFLGAALQVKPTYRKFEWVLTTHRHSQRATSV